jgi:hypothetical protein
MGYDAPRLCPDYERNRELRVLVVMPVYSSNHLTIYSPVHRILCDPPIHLGKVLSYLIYLHLST